MEEDVRLETDCRSTGRRRPGSKLYEDGEYHALLFPCRRDGSSWRDVSANRPIPLRPTHWRLGEASVFQMIARRELRNVFKNSMVETLEQADPALWRTRGAFLFWLRQPREFQ